MNEEKKIDNPQTANSIKQCVSDSLLGKKKESLIYWKQRYGTAYYNWDKEECIGHIKRLENEISALEQ